jgi:hypothetical protein
MHTKLSAAAALVVAAAVATGAATAGHAAAQQRIAITTPGSIDSGALFVLTPLTPGPIGRDSGTRTFCCWARRFVQRDGQAIEIDNPVTTFEGKHGTFVWRERIEWIALEKGYSIGTGTWKILRGTGAYAHLEGHGRIAIVDRNYQGVADRAEGLVDLGR